MSQLRSYKHALTGKVGQYSDAVAALFPELRPVDAAPEPIAIPVDEAPEQITAPESIDGPSVAKKKREVAV